MEPPLSNWANGLTKLSESGTRVIVWDLTCFIGENYMEVLSGMDIGRVW